MRKNTIRLVLLAITLVVLSGIILLKNIITSYMSQNVPRPFKQIKKENVAEVVLQDDKKETKLYKNKNEWVLQKDGIEYRADRERIDTVVDSFINLQKGEVFSNNKNKHIGLGIGPRTISLKWRNQRFVLYIGNPVPVGLINKNFIRIKDESEVFIASGFTEAFSPEDYRDLHVNFVQNEDQINEVELTFDYVKLTLLKKNNEWYSNEKRLKKERVDFFLNDLKTLKASDILKETPSAVNSDLTIKLKENNQQKSVEFFQKDSNSYFLKTSGSEKIFQVDGIYVNPLKKQEKDFTE